MTVMVTRRPSRTPRIQPELSENDWALVLELLQRERSELRGLLENRTGSSPRADLHERLSMVDGIIHEVRRAALRREHPTAP